MEQLTLVDVGHGSCSVFRCDDATMVVDAPTGDAILSYLDDAGVSSVDLAVISHGHTDHTNGIFTLLSSSVINVGSVLLNPEHRRGPDGQPTLFERRMEAALRVGAKSQSKILTGATSDMFGERMIGSLSVSVEWPSGLAAAGGTSVDAGFGKRTTNSMSVVLKVTSSAGIRVVVPGDLDQVGLAEMLDGGAQIRCEILVAPHHGGLLGDERQTNDGYNQLVSSAQPKEILVSLARSQSANPRDELFNAVAMEGLVGCVVRCTQLSSRCGSPPASGFQSVIPVWSKGSHEGHCCAGSIVVDLVDGAVAGAADHGLRVLDLPKRKCSAT